MKDRSWLLNAAAIASAKNCIRIIQKEFGLKLCMSDEDFVAKVERISMRMEMPSLTAAFEALQNYAGPEEGYSKQNTKEASAFGTKLKGARNSLLSKLDRHEQQLHREQKLGEVVERRSTA